MKAYEETLTQLVFLLSIYLHFEKALIVVSAEYIY